MSSLTGSAAVNTAIGLAFLFALLALIASGITEWIARLLQLRAKGLEATLYRLLTETVGPDGAADKTPTRRLSSAFDRIRNKGEAGVSTTAYDRFMNDPLVNSLQPVRVPSFARRTRQARRVAYIPAHTFAIAIEDLLRQYPQTDNHQSTITRLADGLKNMPDFAALPGETQKSLLTSLEGAGDAKPLTGTAIAANLDAAPGFAVLPEATRGQLKALALRADGTAAGFRAEIEGWFDAVMERTSGAYRRKSQVILLVVGFLLAGGMNADAIRVGQALWTDPSLRATVVNVASQTTATTPPTSTGDLAKTAERVQQVESLRLPLGWPGPEPKDWNASTVVLKLLGLFLTGLAVSLGAPFWFDLIGRGLSLKSGGKAPEPSTAAQTAGSGPA